MTAKRQSVHLILAIVLIACFLFVPISLEPAFARGAAIVSAATWYVSTTGSDSNSCTTTGAPCLTINGAIAKAASGDTIDVATGSYTGGGTEVVLVSKNLNLLGGWDAGFTTQSGFSTVDGQKSRRGLTIGSGLTVSVDHFQVQNGQLPTNDAGGGIWNSDGTLTVSHSIISGNSGQIGGGIYNATGVLVVNDGTINGNTGGSSSLSGNLGGGGIGGGGTITVNNSSISGNNVLGDNVGSAVFTVDTVVLNGTTVSANTAPFTAAIFSNFGHVTLNNTTVSGNTAQNGTAAIQAQGGTLALNNSTVSRNTSLNGVGGIVSSYSAVVTLSNSILAGNVGTNLGVGPATPDCYGSIGSAGYNLIGDATNCTFGATTGDRVGTGLAPINPGLSLLQDNGGPTLTHALVGNSPALNAGNPAVPGSGGNACLATDQRGVARPVGSACDIGAYEGHYAAVLSITRVNPNPTSAGYVAFIVTFSDPVTGVREVAPFSDFALTRTGITGGTIVTVTGSGAAYTVKVNTGTGNGTLRLDLVDHDTILDGSSTPLGGPGVGNGNFTAGPVYVIRKIPVPVAPSGTIWDTTPTYQWTKVPSAGQYRYQLFRGITPIYTNTMLAGACGASFCFNTPATLLVPGNYKWRVQAMIGGAWMAFSPFMPFTLYAPLAGYWRGTSNDFYVTPARVQVNKFSIYILVSCGKYRITYLPLIPISKTGTFAFTGAFFGNGAFNKTSLSPSTAHGAVGLSNFLIAGCGYITGGPFTWASAWINGSQPDALNMPEYLPAIVTPMLDAPFNFLPSASFTIEP